MIVYLDDILIYIKDKGQGYVNAVWWILEKLKKYGLYANLKKNWFHKDEVQFLGYIVSIQRAQMEDERIEAVRNWLEPKSIEDIHVFLGFANFYWHFIQSFNKIAEPLPLMLQTTSIITLSKNLLLLMNVA